MKRFLLFSLLLTGLFSCEKDPRYMSPQKYLSQAPWVMAFSQTISQQPGKPNDTTENFSRMDSCTQDLRYVFAAGGNYYSEPGKVRCLGQDLRRKNLGVWSYNASSKTLTTDGNGRIVWQVLSLNDSALQLRYTYTLQDSPLTNTTLIEERHYIHP